jgi:hypothetical protein
MKTDSQLFLEHLQHVFGEESKILTVKSTKPGLPPVACFVYRDLPEEGHITGVTYGLSVAGHPDWKFGRPELVISVKSQDMSWPLSAAWFAESFRGEKSFTYNTILTTDVPLASDTEMCGYFTFAPSIPEPDQQKIQLNNYAIHLTGLYPIYAGEVDLLTRIGLQRFWHLEYFDMFDVQRPDLSRRKR